MDIKQAFKLFLPNIKLNRSLRILVMANTILVFVFGLFVPFYAIFIENMGGSVATAGFTWGLFMIVAGILTLLFSRWELRMKEQELLLAIGYIIRGAAFLSYAFMASMSQLVVTQVLWAVGMALGAPAFDSLYASHTDKDDSIQQWGSWEGIAAISSGSAALIGGVLIQEFGFSAVFLSMAIICFLLGAYIWLLPREVL